MSNYGNVLAVLDGFYRDPDGVTPSPPPPSQPAGDIFQFAAAAGAPQQPTNAPGDDGFGDDDDDWGGFETAEPAAAGPAAVGTVAVAPSQPKPFNAPPVTSPVPALADPFQSFAIASPDPAPVPVQGGSSLSRYSEDLTSSFSNQPLPEPSWSSPHVAPRAPKDPNVLFDAEEAQEELGGNGDDDFGDFEAVEGFGQGFSQKPTSSANNPPPQAPPSADLLSLGDLFPALETTNQKPANKPGLLLGNIGAAAPSTYPPPLKSPPFQQRNPYRGLSISTPTKETFHQEESTNSPVTAWPGLDDDVSNSDFKDDWPPFEDFPPEKQVKPKPAKPKSVKATATAAIATNEADNWDWDPVEPEDTAKPQSVAPILRDDYDDKEPPPTNIPPPSVLMAILPELFSLANTSLFKPTAGLTAAAKKKIMSDPATLAFLRGYLLIAIVAARIVAGRRLRWHRDKFLARSMAISAAGSKGMKLAGVDKAQASREDREAADVVTAWREHVGRVRSGVAAANAAAPSSTPLKVPEITETMPVTSAKVVPTAPRPCVICGLKRDERVAKVDFEVEDSFGEWWVEHWGHRACRNFWKEHEKALRQR